MFKDKVVAITGAGSGIGRALALNLAKRGARLALSDINSAGLAGTLALLGDGVDANVYVVDVASKQQVYDFADNVEQDFGAVHFIFNNAGTAIFGTIDNVSTAEIERVININMWGAIYGTKAFLAKMLPQREGCIVNISSVFGLAAAPCQGAYNISKFAIRGLTETLWSELEGTGVRAVVVHPGGIKTSIDIHSSICANGGEFEQRVSATCATTLVTPPEDCAEQIVTGLLQQKPRLLVGDGAKALHWISRLFPTNYMKIIGKKVGL